MSSARVTEFQYANGMNKSQAKKVCLFAFGNYYHMIEKNIKERRYDIYLKNSIEGIEIKEACDIDYFVSFWGREFHLIILQLEDSSNKKEGIDSSEGVDLD